MGNTPLHTWLKAFVRKEFPALLLHILRRVVMVTNGSSGAVLPWAAFCYAPDTHRSFLSLVPGAVYIYLYFCATCLYVIMVLKSLPLVYKLLPKGMDSLIT